MPTFFGGGAFAAHSSHVITVPVKTEVEVNSNPGLNTKICPISGAGVKSVEAWVSYANDRLWLVADGVEYPVACCTYPGKDPYINVHKVIPLNGVNCFYFYADDNGCRFGGSNQGGPSGFGGVVYKYKINYVD